MTPLFHIAKKVDWQDAKKRGSYTTSTLNKTYEEVGYIHMSFAHQVKLVADFLYKDIDDLLLLKIDPDKLTAKIKVETVEGTTYKFPHLYGPLNINAVDEVTNYSPLIDDGFPDVKH